MCRSQPPSPARAPSTLKQDKSTNPEHAGGKSSDLETGAGRQSCSPARPDLATGDAFNSASAPPDDFNESSSDYRPLEPQERNVSESVPNQASSSW